MPRAPIWPSTRDPLRARYLAPIAVMALAKIAELIPDPETRALALQIEAKHWRELLALYRELLP